MLLRNTLSKFFLKNSSVSRKPEKSGLGKNERLGGLKTRKGGLCKSEGFKKKEKAK